MEMGGSYDGFLVRIIKVIERLRFHLGDSGLNDQISLFLAYEDNRSSKKAKLYLKEIMRLHGVAVSIVSDQDARFTSMFWKEL